MTMENWIQLIVPALGVASAALAYYFSKKQQMLADESRLKEKFYLNYIAAVSDIVVNPSGESRDKLADAQNQLLLVGSAEVVRDLMAFHDYIKPESGKIFDPVKHDEILTELLKSMRSDLYRTPKVNDNYPLIHLTGKTVKASQK